MKERERRYRIDEFLIIFLDEFITSITRYCSMKQEVTNIHGTAVVNKWFMNDVTMCIYHRTDWTRKRNRALWFAK